MQKLGCASESIDYSVYSNFCYVKRSILDNLSIILTFTSALLYRTYFWESFFILHFILYFKYHACVASSLNRIYRFGDFMLPDVPYLLPVNIILIRMMHGLCSKTMGNVACYKEMHLSLEW